MKRTLNVVGKTLTAVAAVMAVTSTFAEADGYGFDAAAHANKIIKHTPHTGYGWKPSYAGHGWKPAHQGWAKPVTYQGHLAHKYGHGVVTYNPYAQGYPYGYAPVVKRTTIVKPVIVHPYKQVTYGYAPAVAHQTVTDIRGPIFFNSGSSHLTQEAKAELIEIGQIIKAHIHNPSVVIQLSGFTDAKGSQAANLALAKSRNHRVKDFLIESFGFDAARFSLRAVGEAYANASVAAQDEGQRKVMVSLLGLPKQAEATLAPPVAYEAPAVSQYQQVPPQPNWHASARCTLPTTPYGNTYAAGQLAGATFTDIDDYGGGQLVEYCNFGQ